MAKLGSVGKALLGPVGSALVTGKFDLASSLPGVLMGAKTREEKRREREEESEDNRSVGGPKSTMRKGGKVKKMAKGGSVSSASKRADGCATKGKTKGRFV